MDALSQINVSGLAGVAQADIALDRGGLAFIAGANASGKSSVLEAIRLALTGDGARRADGASKADWIASLVHDGHAKGTVALGFDSGKPRTVQFRGSTIDAEGPTLSDAQAVMLDTSAFFGLPPKLRRDRLHEALGVDFTPAAVKAALIASGCDAEHVAEVESMLLSGPAAGAEYATRQATEARGAWKATTGEAYGDKKAEGWRAVAPTVTETRTLAELEADHAAAMDALAAAKAAADVQVQQPAAAADAEALAAAAAEVAALEKRIADADAWLIARRAELVEVEKAAHPAQGTIAPCPHCGKSVAISRGNLTAVDDPAPGAPHPAEAFERLTALQAKIGGGEARRLALHGELAKVGRNHTALLLAKQDAAPGVSADEHAARQRELGNARAAEQVARSALTAHRDALQASNAAVERSRAAAKYHADVQAWKHIADRLGPDGIPAELGGIAVEAVNAKLPALYRLHADMSMTINARPRELCSESEQWRADAHLAVALAALADLPVVLLDRFDVIEPAKRIDVLVALSEVSTVPMLIAGTLKSAPTALPLDCYWRTYWMQSGRSQLISESPRPQAAA